MLLMKKIIVILVTVLLLYGCASPRLANSVWCTIKEVSNGGQTGVMVESIYFLNNEKANILRSVLADSCLVVAPYKYADADYKLNEITGKEDEIVLNAINLQGDSLETKGLINIKKNTLILQDAKTSSKTIYVKNPNIIIE